MKISPAAELAVRGTLVLARQFGQGPVALSSVCADGELPRQYLMKIFASLAKAGIVTPLRGKHGGYVLARQPDLVTLLEVIEAVEGPLCLNYCQHSPPKCDRVTCKVRPVWTELQQIVREKLSSVRLSDCVAEEDQNQAAPGPADQR
jgi:Rrf2 family cysteine metabolism transcriptional repressor